MPAVCRVATLLPKFDRAVARWSELDDLGAAPGYGGLDPKKLRRRQNESWRHLRHLEAQAMLETATSEEGRTLQIVLAIPEAYALRCWAHEDVGALAAYSRMNGVLKSLVAPRDLTVLRPETVDFYIGTLLGRQAAARWRTPGVPSAGAR